MENNKSNPNWQDKLLGGAVLTGLVMIAVIAALFALITRDDERTGERGSSKITVGSSTHAFSPTPSTPSTN
jgi:hypothetical protein